MLRINKNFQIAVSALTDSRSDHYDGVNAIYRLAAYVPIPKGSSPHGIKRQIKKLLKDLERLEVRANRIFIYDDTIEIDFYPKGFQMVMSLGQYVGLIIEFAAFINKAPIQDLLIRESFNGDDPEDSVRSVGNDMVNFFPEFNSTCFGAEEKEPIEIINCSEYGEVA